MTVRPAEATATAAIAAIYNEGIASRDATFETEPRDAAAIHAWIGDDHPVVVVEEDGSILGVAAAFPYRARPCYAGVAELSVYVAGAARRRGVGAAATAARE